MDAPVSAFAMYKANKSANKTKKQRKRNKAKKMQAATAVAQPVISEEKTKQIALKFKQKQKKAKVQKNLPKKKQNKKKKSKVNNNKNAQQAAKKEETVPKQAEVPASDDSEVVPSLVPAPTFNGNGPGPGGDSACAHSNFKFTPVETDSVEEGLKVFKWLIAPYDPKEFLKNVWEKKPMHIARKKPNFYHGMITTPIIDDMLRNENIQFTKNVDITSYVDGKRQTHNPEGRAHPHLVWDFYLSGCSVRLLNPQTYIPKLHLLNATMQEYFNSFVGANAYLTPPDSQGFAPHYDDIEAFILQTEGKKLWRIYNPLNDKEVLPRVSSKNFEQNEIGEPILEVMLEPGDMLYFPRGYIHQGVTVAGEHSLHVTISMYQKHAWADLFEKLIPAALQMAINEHVELRYGLPFDIYNHFGLVHSDNKAPRREEICKIVSSLFDKIKSHLPMDDAVDQMHRHYQHAALPPVLHDLEKAVTVYGDSDVMIENGVITNRVEISLDTKIRLLRKNILRMVSEDKLKIYYYVENSLEYHGYDLPFLEIEEEFAPAIETLIKSYPNYVAVENLDVAEDMEKIQIADALWSRGLVMTQYPLQSVESN